MNAGKQEFALTRHLAGDGNFACRAIKSDESGARLNGRQRDPSTGARDDRGTAAARAALPQSAHGGMARNFFHCANKQLAARRNLVPGRYPAWMRQWDQIETEPSTANEK